MKLTIRVLFMTAFTSMFMFTSLPTHTIAARPTWPEQHAMDYGHVMKDGLGGWNILQDDYRSFNVLDGFSLEWDYYSLHDENGNFTGSLGIVLADPEGKLGGSDYEPLNLMPSGINVALYGKFKGEDPFAIYVPFGLGQQAGVKGRSAYATRENGLFVEQIPVRGENGAQDTIIMRGNIGEYAWDLNIRQGFLDYAPLKPDTWVIGNDTNGLFDREHWTVNMIWPTTEVRGTITKLATGEVVSIDGHGYRENSFGRWAFVLGGWDFAFISDPETHVQWAFQTYHFNTEDLDYLDVDFLDKGTPVVQRFKAKEGELGWYHNDWNWDEDANQYVPDDLVVVAKNDLYTVEAYVTIGANESPLMSDVTRIVSTYTIFAQMPWISGTITRTETGEPVAEFDGQGGGEFAVMRSFRDDLSDPVLKKQIFTRTFANPLP